MLFDEFRGLLGGNADYFYTLETTETAQKAPSPPAPLPSQKTLRERGEFFAISRRKFRTLPSPGAFFARGEGQGVRVLFAPSPPPRRVFKISGTG